MAIAQYRILDVTDDGFVTVKWANADGPAVTYPVPFDDAGEPLAGTALEDWLAARWEDDIEEQVDRSKSFETLRAARRPDFKNIQDKVDARRRKAAGGGDS